MAYLTLLYACLPLSTTLFMWQAHQNTQESMGKSKGQSPPEGRAKLLKIMDGIMEMVCEEIYLSGSLKRDCKGPV